MVGVMDAAEGAANQLQFAPGRVPRMSSRVLYWTADPWQRGGGRMMLVAG